MTHSPADPQPRPPAVDSKAPHCHRCGYDLRGLASSGRCPECGLAIRMSMRRTELTPTAVVERWDLVHNGCWWVGQSAWLLAPFLLGLSVVVPSLAIGVAACVTAQA